MCRCSGQLTRGKPAPGRIQAQGEPGMLLLMAAPEERTPHVGPVTRAFYPFDQRPSMWVDVRDAVYFLGPSLRLA